ncbi:hypothetical protein EBU71_00190 [bacterium]|nr:hypothetical protein [Candidatus Elulimicrobium humile]
MKYIVDLSLPFKSPTPFGLESYREIALKEIEKDPLVQNYGLDLPPSAASSVAHSFFKSYGYLIVGCEYFYFQPKFAMGIHIDGSRYCHKAKFNWAFGGKHSFRFFEPLTSGVSDGVSNNANSPYSLQFKENEVEEKANQTTGSPSLVCVGVPHQVINGSEPLELFNISIWKEGLKREQEFIDLGGMNMEEGLEVFKKYVI